MAYRSIQRVLGETTLERKCLFFFGTSLFLLIIGSFWWYGWATTRLVYANTRSNCGIVAETGLFKFHALSDMFGDEYEAGNDEEARDERQMLDHLASKLQHLDYEWTCLGLDTPRVGSRHSAMPVPDAWEKAMLKRMREDYLMRLDERKAASSNASTTATPSSQDQMGTIYETYVDQPPISVDRTVESKRYDYYQVVDFDRDCVACHIARMGLDVDPNQDPIELLKDPSFFRVVKVSLPFENTQRAINRNYAIVLAVAIVTVFLALLALYGIVRVLIVRPVQHLRDVSEQVECGNYDARAEIETQDEFEELAHAFNGMLRHLVEAQNKLKVTNTELDGKLDQLAQANMQLYEMNRLKSDFLANVSHELRTPLNSIIGFSEILKDIATLDDRQKRYVAYIRDSGRGLLDMINDILDLAKIESGKMDVRPSEFPVHSVVQAQVDFQRALADEKNLDLSVDCPAKLPPMYQDPAKVGQIAANLISNAIKFTPDGGSVRIVIRAEPPITESDGEANVTRTLVLQVIDTGVGIAKEDQESIFEKFRQAGTLRGDNLTREFSGTGLGLSIVRELCKLLRGSVSVESELGRGSTFTVRLPWRLPEGILAGLDDERSATADYSLRSPEKASEVLN